MLINQWLMDQNNFQNHKSMRQIYQNLSVNSTVFLGTLFPCSIHFCTTHPLTPPPQKFFGGGEFFEKLVILLNIGENHFKYQFRYLEVLDFPDRGEWLRKSGLWMSHMKVKPSKLHKNKVMGTYRKTLYGSKIVLCVYCA